MGNTAARLLREALDRVVLLVGASTVELVDGKLSDDDGAAGFLHVVTGDRLIRAVFSTTRNSDGNVTTTLRAESVPLSAVRSVRVEHVGTSSEEDDAWPSRARIRLILDRELAGETEIELPSAVTAESHHASAVAALAQRLPV
ncbi:hypothetical protein [Microbacterium sp. ZKA21]|uniref:hypothetical protein n=1 Tax=Microbacterium sp. ZKA21 TaxID=3381694 RepID=UPI003D24DD59